MQTIIAENVAINVTNIIQGVDLMVYKNDEAALLIGDSLVEFKWSKDAEVLFEELDVCEPIELLAILATTIN
ncbi:hypothetical protein ACIQ4I_10430 [Rummeliibacillus sp. NPDC094406]|uniref:hypothetical protein n=1 Tax=Rummeliibacillus sp. NPDC094406 TaxID=3364511 RepID=UPI00382C129D